METLLYAIGKNELIQIVQPVIDVCEAVVPTLLVVVGALGGIWCILLGVKYATADDPQEHEKAKKALKNSIIGFILIFVLLLGLNKGTQIFTDWYESTAS